MSEINANMVVTTEKEVATMPIKSKKQSVAKQEWMAANSKVYGVRVMNNENEKDLWDFLKAQEAPATTIKIALREYMKNHTGENTT